MMVGAGNCVGVVVGVGVDVGVCVTVGVGVDVGVCVGVDGGGEACADQSSGPSALYVAVKNRLPPAAVKLEGVSERLPSSVVPAAVPSLCQRSGPLDEG